MDWNAEVREIWNRNAPWWDEKIGAEGNAYHRLLVAPATNSRRASGRPRCRRLVGSGRGDRSSFESRPR